MEYFDDLKNSNKIKILIETVLKLVYSNSFDHSLINVALD